PVTEEHTTYKTHVTPYARPCEISETSVDFPKNVLRVGRRSDAQGNNGRRMGTTTAAHHRENLRRGGKSFFLERTVWWCSTTRTSCGERSQSVSVPFSEFSPTASPAIAAAAAAEEEEPGARPCFFCRRWRLTDLAMAAMVLAGREGT
ncbi:MAG: hypothetical protein BJ554DRAFT_6734, partial [Olpidium bornovanus]